MELFPIPPKETLRQKQSRFARQVGVLLGHATVLGYEVTFAEAYRPPELAQLYAQQGRGIRNSLHTKRLAVDLNVFRAGVLLTDGNAFADLGSYWKGLSVDARWGGDFKDGNHFSLEHDGVK